MLRDRMVSVNPYNITVVKFLELPLEFIITSKKLELHFNASCRQSGLSVVFSCFSKNWCEFIK